MTNATPQDFRDLKGVGCRQHKIKCECFLTFLSNPWHFILFKLCAQSSVKSTREQCLEGPMGFFSGRKKTSFVFLSSIDLLNFLTPLPFCFTITKLLPLQEKEDWKPKSELIFDGLKRNKSYGKNLLCNWSRTYHKM